MAKIVIIGAGVWGISLSLLASRNGHEVRVWSRRSQEQVKQLFANLSNHFPGSWLAFDSVSPFIVKNQKHHDSLRHTSAKFDWGIEDIRLIKNWDSRYEVMEVYTYRDLLTRYQRRFSLFTRLISLIPVFSSMYRVALIRLG